MAEDKDKVNGQYVDDDGQVHNNFDDIVEQGDDKEAIPDFEDSADGFGDGLDEAPKHVVVRDDVESKLTGGIGTLDINVGKISDADFAKEMRTSFLEYSMSVIVARALPDVRDGLKPVHRRILYSMYDANITPNKPHVKSARSVGDCMGKYHPHGDAAIYDTMVRMAQDFSMRVPLIDGHGNFGSVDGDAAAAMRYTEARLDKQAMELLADLDKETVDWQPNYDESLQEPKVLPARFPNLLVNGSAGIAVGMATNIPPHNLGESIDAAIAVMEDPDIELDELMKIIPTSRRARRSWDARASATRTRRAAAPSPSAAKRMSRRAAPGATASSSPRSPTRSTRHASSRRSPTWCARRPSPRFRA